MKFIPLKSPDYLESEYVNYIDLGAKKGVSKKDRFCEKKYFYTFGFEWGLMWGLILRKKI